MKRWPCALQLAAQLAVVVDLAVADQPQRAVLVRQRLVAAGEIDDRQPAHADRQRPVDVQAFVVGAAMARDPRPSRDSVAAGARAPVEVEDAVDAAHGVSASRPRRRERAAPRATQRSRRRPGSARRCASRCAPTRRSGAPARAIAGQFARVAQNAIRCACASASASPALNRKPVSPSRISSRWPPTSEATNIRPCAIASSGFSGVTSSVSRIGGADRPARRSARSSAARRRAARGR